MSICFAAIKINIILKLKKLTKPTVGTKVELKLYCLALSTKAEHTTYEHTLRVFYKYFSNIQITLFVHTHKK